MAAKTKEEDSRKILLDVFFGDISHRQPDVTFNGQHAWLHVAIMGGAEKATFGIEEKRFGAQVDFVAVLVDGEKTVVSTIIVPRDVIAGGQSLPGEADRRVTRNRLAADYILSHVPGIQQFVG